MATKIKVEATVNANKQKVWDYWTKPEHIIKWNFASDDWHCPSAENDLRVGGKMKSRMEAKDGSFGFDFEGIYGDVVDQEKISYTMADGRQCTTTFDGFGDKTNMVTPLMPKTSIRLTCRKVAGRQFLTTSRRTWRGISAYRFALPIS